MRARLHHAWQRSSLRDRLFLVALLSYGGALWLLRPLTPFEQDEVLFLKALESYDVAKHSPHPPGYPLYVAIGRAVRWVVSDPVAALQLVSVLAAVAAVAAVWRLARRLGATSAGGVAAAAVAASIPTFTYHANVGFSDIPATAFAIAAALALVSALDRPASLPLAAAVVAAAAAVRPQVVVALLPLGVAAIVVAVCRHDWRPLALAVPTGALVSVACWLPAIVLTGPARFWQALRDASAWVREHEATAHLPRAPLGPLAHQWLVVPFGSPALAALFWVLVAAGSAAWWRAGRRRLVTVALGCGGTYLAVCAFAFGMGEAARYALPALPFFALLAGGVVAVGPAVQRRGAAALLAAWCVAADLWLWPVIALRAGAPAPAWEGLSFVATHMDPATTTVVFDNAFRPHVGYLLSPRGFQVEERRAGVAYASEVPGGSVVFVTQEPDVEGVVLLRRAWSLARLQPFTRHLYDRCTVTRAPEAASARFSSAFRAGPSGWMLKGSGAVSLPEGVPTQIVRVAAGHEALTVVPAASPPRRIAAGGEAFVPLGPGPTGTLRIEVPGSETARLPALEMFPVGAPDWGWFAGGGGDRDLIVPAAAHVHGRRQSDWVTDLLVHNPDAGVPLEVEVRWSERLDQSGAVLTRRRTIAPAATVLIRDVLESVFAAVGSGAMHLSAARPFTLLWRTYDRNVALTLEDPAFLRPPGRQQMSRRGSLGLTYRPGDEGIRANAGFFNPGPEPVEVRIEIRKRGESAAPAVTLLHLPAWGFDFRDGGKLVGPSFATAATDYDLSYSATRAVLAFVAVVENASGRSHYVFVGQAPAAPTPVPR
jgi:4-amino-4-deoxy-L-arabinose transferase-like glycosyltransferase